MDDGFILRRVVEKLQTSDRPPFSPRGARVGSRPTCPHRASQHLIGEWVVHLGHLSYVGRCDSPVRHPAKGDTLTPCLFYFIFLYSLFFFLFSSRPHLPGLCVKQPCRLCYAGDADRPVDGATRGLRISPPWMRMPLLLLLHAQQRIAARVESGCV